MYVYLDHAHIVALDLLLSREPTTFGEFLEFWHNHGCKLVISRAHLHEIGQSTDERDVERRLKVLRYFSIWSGREIENVDWVIIREMLHQTLHRLRQENDCTSAAYLALREELYRPVQHADIERLIWQWRPGWLQELRFRREQAAHANVNISLQKKYRSLTKRKEPKWDPDGWRMLPLVHSLLPATGGDPVADRWMTEIKSRAPDCWKRTKRKRQALVCMYDLAGLSSLERAPEQDLSRLGFYRALAKRWVVPYCRLEKHDPEMIQSALDHFDPYDAPGISASLAVERGRKLHDKEFEASDFKDAEHVLWAAHADLAFVDKRTLGFLSQARQTRGNPPLLSPHLRVRFERTVSLGDVKQHIAAVHGERLRGATSSGHQL